MKTLMVMLNRDEVRLMLFDNLGFQWVHDLNRLMDEIASTHAKNKKLFDLAVSIQKLYLEPQDQEDEEEQYSEYKVKKFLI